MHDFGEALTPIPPRPIRACIKRAGRGLATLVIIHAARPACVL